MESSLPRTHLDRQGPQDLWSVPHGPVVGSGAHRRQRRIVRLMALSDAGCILTALIVAYLSRFGDLRMGRGFSLVVLLAPLGWLTVARTYHLYDPHLLSTPEEVRSILSASAVGMGVLSVVAFWSNQSFSRAWLGLAWLLLIALELGTRFVWRAHLRRQRMAGGLRFRTVIVGAGNEAEALAQAAKAPALGFLPVGYVTVGAVQRRSDGFPVLGSLPRLVEIIRANDVECLLVASTEVDPSQMRRILRAARATQVQVRISARLPEVIPTRLHAQPLGNTMALSLEPARFTRAQAAAKRLFDLCLASIALILTAPFLAAVAVAVKATSDGPILFRQTRVGRLGRRFTMYKFRTMHEGAEALRSRLAARNEAGGLLFKIREDARITPLGRVLRRWCIDEIPQLLNVLKGDMSLVGPRPPLPDEVDKYEEWHHERLDVLPGMSGLWQVSDRSDLRFDEYVRLDLFYVENWSLFLDLSILAKTIPAVLLRRGSY